MSNFEVLGLPIDEMHVFLGGAHPDPFRILGPHRVGENLVIRAFRPDAKELRVIANGNEVNADRLSNEGFFQAVLPGLPRESDYRLRVVRWDGSEEVVVDPYRYGMLMGEIDLYLFSEGNHHRLYDKMGAHIRSLGDVTGVYFAVWAPNAQRVS